MFFDSTNPLLCFTSIIPQNYLTMIKTTKYSSKTANSKSFIPALKTQKNAY